jgi:hypothetical protein
MTDQERVQELLNRSRLPDPCTLVFSVPIEAPSPVDDEGWTWTVEQWIYLAHRQGHTASRTGHGIPTWCGDIDIDGLTYQVHRRPCKRILALYVENGAEVGRFELQESGSGYRTGVLVSTWSIRRAIGSTIFIQTAHPGSSRRSCAISRN